MRLAGLDEAYGTEPDAAENGVWVRFEGGLELRMLPDISPKMREHEQFMLRKYREHLNGGVGKIPPEIEVNMELDRVLAATLDWRAKDENGQPVPFNRAELKAVLVKYPYLRKDAIYRLRVKETFRKQDLDELGKSSATASEPA